MCVCPHFRSHFAHTQPPLPPPLSPLKACGAGLSRAAQPCINLCKLIQSRLLSAQQPALTAHIPALITTEIMRTALTAVCPTTSSTSLCSHRPKWRHQQQAISHLTHLTKRDVQDFANSWRFHARFIFVLRKISIELSERHLHHKIKRYTLHISNLDKINMCLKIVKSDRCNTIVVAYCLQVKKW